MNKPRPRVFSEIRDYFATRRKGRVSNADVLLSDAYRELCAISNELASSTGYFTDKEKAAMRYAISMMLAGEIENEKIGDRDALNSALDKL